MVSRLSARGAAVLLLAFPFVTHSACAQLSASGRVLGASAYVFRGITVTSRPVLQPSLELSAGPEAALLTAGVWGNVEPAAYDAPRDLSESGGVAGLTELDLYLGVSRTAGWLTLQAGGAAYLYPNDSVSTPDDNGVELYAGASTSLPLAPSLTYYHGVAGVIGGYLEGAAGAEVPLAGMPLALGAILGLSAGQGGDGGYFARNGFTHLDLAASTQARLGPLAVEPEVHLVIAVDPATRPVDARRERGAWLWVGMAVSASRELLPRR